MSLKSISKSKVLVIVLLLVAVGFFGLWLSSFNFAVARNGEFPNQEVDYICFRVEEAEEVGGVVEWRYLNKHFLEAGMKISKAEFRGPTLFCTPVSKRHLEAHR